MSKMTKIEMPAMTEEQANELNGEIWSQLGIVVITYEQCGAWRMFIATDNWLIQSIDRIIAVTDFAWNWMTNNVTDEQIEAVKSAAAACEDFELFDACETATKMIVQHELRAQAVSEILQAL